MSTSTAIRGPTCRRCESSSWDSGSRGPVWGTRNSGVRQLPQHGDGRDRQHRDAERPLHAIYPSSAFAAHDPIFDQARDHSPVARSGLGWMLLSARSDETIEKLVRRINFEEEDRKKKVDLKELMQRIRKIRKDGYVISLHTVTAGAGVIGMLLPERRHGRILAIGVGGPVERLVSKRTHILRVAARRHRRFRLRGTIAYPRKIPHLNPFSHICK